jgi:thiol-disulfide isomerase/thioredoxin
MRFIFSIVAALLFVSSAVAAPQFSGTWVNSAPMKVDGLKGKVVVLYFYEESCPTCRGKWPALLAAADTFKDQPVVFIAVNSGNDPKAVEGYLAGVNCSWAALADTDRSFEKAYKVGTVSLQNIYQMRVITPAGTIAGGNPADLEGTVKAHLANAKWKVDPKLVPEPLKATWKALEYGDYALASPVVKRLIKAKDEKTKAAVEAMDQAITADLDALVAAAAAAEKAGQKWDAYKLFDQAAREFKGYPKATEAAASAKRLGADKDLKDEIKAKGILDKAREMLASNNRQNRRQGETTLESLAKEFPKTEAGALAEEMMKAAAKE